MNCETCDKPLPEFSRWKKCRKHNVEKCKTAACENMAHLSGNSSGYCGKCKRKNRKKGTS